MSISLISRRKQDRPSSSVMYKGVGEDANKDEEAEDEEEVSRGSSVLGPGARMRVTAATTLFLMKHFLVNFHFA